MSDISRPHSHSHRRGRVVSLVAVVSTFALTFISCRDHSTRWGGKIEERDGIVVVENPASPIHRNAALSLEEELSIGREDAGEEYLFSDITGFDASDEGSIYVINRPDANVRVFDRNGLFLKTIGRKGQGPGEMEMPVYIQIGVGRDIFIFDYAGRGLSEP